MPSRRSSRPRSTAAPTRRCVAPFPPLAPTKTGVPISASGARPVRALPCRRGSLSAAAWRTVSRARGQPPRRVDGVSGTRTLLSEHFLQAQSSFSTIQLHSWCSGCGPHYRSRAANCCPACRLRAEPGQPHCKAISYQVVAVQATTSRAAAAGRGAPCAHAPGSSPRSPPARPLRRRRTATGASSR